ncbi:MAG: hypothetical protein LBG06_05060 [Deltaproteobacteria bacterium]|jgi:hypothetical protein|nr:hypothetical protein [Deltaproteobacteria bacterium]
MTPQPSARPRARTVLARAALLALPAFLCALAVVSCSKKGEEDAWKSFQILMDSSFGQGGWSVSSRSFDSATDTLTAEAVKVDLSRASQTLPPEYRGILTGQATARLVRITGILPSAEMRKLAEAASWTGDKDLELAKAFTVEEAVLPIGDGTFEALASLDSLSATGLLLRAAAPGAPPAEGTQDLSLLTALEIGVLSEKGFRITGRLPAAGGPAATGAGPADGAEGAASVKEAAGSPAAISAEFSLGSFEARGLGHAEPAELYPGAPDYLAILLSQKAQSLAWKDLSLKATSEDGLDLAITASDIQIEGMRRSGAATLLRVAGLALALGGNDPSENVSVSLDSLEAKDYDLTPAFPEWLQALQQVVETGDTQALASARDLDELFVFPYSFGSVTLRGLAVDGMGYTVKDGSLAALGPVLANKLSNHSTEISLHIALSADPAARSAEAAADLQRILGRTDFRLALRSSVATEPERDGSYQFTLDALDAEGLGALTGTLRLSGVTPELVEALSDVNPRNANPFTLLGIISPLGVQYIDLNYKDASLVDALVKDAAGKAGQTPLQYKLALAERFRAGLIDQFGAPPAVFQKATDALRSFLATPSAISVSAAPRQSVTMDSVSPYLTLGDFPGLMDFLNLTMKSGDSAPVPLFDSAALGGAWPPPAGGSGEGEEVVEEEVDEFDID